jgi:ATP-dependent exoDNAse (exonuclease V) beta subunit
LTRRTGAAARQDLEIARAAALAAGVAIHRTLEDLDLEADPRSELARQSARLEARIAAVTDLGGEGATDAAALRGAALERALSLLDRFATGALAERLWAISRGIVARELEVWLPGASASQAASAAAAPLRYVAGAIDVLYRDPSDGEWVVADYKTDRVASRAEVDARAEVYASQGAIYTRAVQEALDLPHRPRFELWFLDADLVVGGGGP